VIATPGSSRLRRLAAPALGARSVAGYGSVAVALEGVRVLAGPTAAAVGYAALMLLVANHLAVALLRSGLPAGEEAASSALLLIPFGLRLVALTLEGSAPVSIARHYALVGPSAVTAVVCVAVTFPGLRPRLDTLVRSRGQILVALSGLAIGLLGAVVFSPASLAPLGGRWGSRPVLLVLVVAAGLTEELLFRGFLQDALRRVLGARAPFAGAGALVLAYLDVHPIGVACAAVVIGFCSALVVEWSGRLGGVLAGRALLNTGLFVFWPWLLGSR
jgi:membrane protease YdiL (CAAX protease family)